MIFWNIFTDQVCHYMFECSTEHFYHVQITWKKKSIQNEQFEFNTNVTNIIAEIFIFCEQNVKIVAEYS